MASPRIRQLSGGHPAALAGDIHLDGNSFVLSRDSLAARLDAGHDAELRILLDTFCTIELGAAA